MSINKGFIGELQHEAALTRKILGAVPMDKRDWRPHPKSMTVGRLATHIAETFNWTYAILTADEFDFAARPSEPHTAASSEELLGIFETNLQKALTALENAGDEAFGKIWTVKRGEQVLYQTPKKVAVRGWGFSHMIHHRGQLSVFLRLLDVPIPGMYGPSADER